MVLYCSRQGEGLSSCPSCVCVCVLIVPLAGAAVEVGGAAGADASRHTRAHAHKLPQRKEQSPVNPSDRCSFTLQGLSVAREYRAFSRQTGSASVFPLSLLVLSYNTHTSPPPPLLPPPRLSLYLSLHSTPMLTI